MAIQSQPSRISEPFAGSGSKNAIPATNATPSASQAASWASGFPPECSQPISAGGCPVPRNDMNGVLNQLSQDYSFRQDGGVWAWSALADYGTNRLVLGSDGLLYWSVAQSGPNVGGAQDPTTDNGTYWQLMPMNNANVVHIAGTERITGQKTFSLSVFNEDQYITIAKNIDVNTYPDSTTYHTYLTFSDKNNVRISDIYGAISSSGGTESNFRLRGTDLTTAVSLSLRISGTGNKTVYLDADHFYPGGDGTCTLGDAGNKWGQIYSTSGSISTSDARLKTEPESVPDEVLDAWGDVNFVQFQMLDRVEAKGADKARLHSGLIAQRIEEAFSAHGLDARRYGLFCWDEWEAEPEGRDPEGNITRPALEAGDCYSLRYEEALCMEAAFQRRRADRAEARLAALEDRLAAIEAKLNS